MGYAQTLCISIPVDVGQIDLTCSYGTIGEVYSFGVNTKDTRNACVQNEENSICAPTNVDLKPAIEACIGSVDCLINVSADDIYNDPTLESDQCTNTEAFFFI
jgi:hypothetical protein